MAMRKLKGLAGRLLHKAAVRNQYKEFVDRIEQARAMQRTGKGLDDEYHMQKLRQAAHIVDKGLQRKDWQPGHSAKWYERAQEHLSGIASRDMLQDPSGIWALEVLETYERAQIDGHVTRPQSSELGPGCEYEQLLSAIMARRSARFFREEEVALDVVEKVVDVINWSPNSCNKQAAQVFVTTTPSLAQEGLSTCKGATGFGTYIPAFLCFCADLRSYWLPPEMLLPLVDVSLGIQNCCLVASSLGLSITLLSWAQHTQEDEQKLRGLLGIPSYCQIIVNGAMGYPERIPETPGRKRVESTYVLR